MVDIRTQLFQDTASQLENLIDANPEIGDRPDLIDTFLIEKGYENPEEFYNAYKEFDDAKKAGETDFRAKVLDVDDVEFGDSAIADVGEAVVDTAISGVDVIVLQCQVTAAVFFETYKLIELSNWFNCKKML